MWLRLLCDNGSKNNMNLNEMIIPSKTVRNYLEERAYKFRDCDKATLLYNRLGDYPLKVIHEKLNDIREQTEDQKLKKEITEYLQEEQCIWEAFTNNTGAVYKVLYSKDEVENGFFCEYSDAYEWGKLVGLSFSILKLTLFSARDARIPKIDMYLDLVLGKAVYNSVGELLTCSSNEVPSVDWEARLEENRFEDAFVCFPHPFQKGDFVWNIRDKKLGIVYAEQGDELLARRYKKFEGKNGVGSFDMFILEVDTFEKDGLQKHLGCNPRFYERIPEELLYSHEDWGKMKYTQIILLEGGSIASLMKVYE